MKLQTSIAPRRDGTVTVLGKDRQTYVFAAGPDGELTADVADESTVAHLLATGNFWPADESDAEQAPALVKQAEKAAGDEDEDDEPTIAALLATGNFWPADESDAEQAPALVKQAEKAAGDEDEDDEPTIAALLATGNFWPADESDAEQAPALVKQAEKAAGDEDEDDEPADALPVEANTPPKRRGRPRKAE